MSGFIYCASADGTDYKIGQTRRPAEQRLAEANRCTWVINPFKFHIVEAVEHSKQHEWAVHKLLEDYRVNKRKEFFKAPLTKIKQAFKFVSGDEKSFVGCLVGKNFGNVYMGGYVKSYREPYWRVAYDDGDREDYDWKELICGIKKARDISRKKMRAIK
jgi:hypothetical protein